MTACDPGNESAEKQESEEITEEQNNDATEEVSKETKETPEENDKESDETSSEDMNTDTVNNDFQRIYNELTGKSFIFSSGAGAWHTTFTFTDNGHFSGTYSDANGPEVDASDFTGQFNIAEEVDEFTYQLELDSFQVTSETGKEEADGEMVITYVDEPHGFQSKSDIFELYLPYKPKGEVSEEYLSWVYGQANNEYDFLNSFGLYNVNYQFGMEELLD